MRRYKLLYYNAGKPIGFCTDIMMIVNNRDNKDYQTYKYIVIKIVIQSLLLVTAVIHDFYQVLRSSLYLCKIRWAFQHYSTVVSSVYHVACSLRGNFDELFDVNRILSTIWYCNAGKPIGSCTDTKMNGELNRNHK